MIKRCGWVKVERDRESKAETVDIFFITCEFVKKKERERKKERNSAGC